MIPQQAWKAKLEGTLFWAFIIVKKQCEGYIFLIFTKYPIFLVQLFHTFMGRRNNIKKYYGVGTKSKSEKNFGFKSYLWVNKVNIAYCPKNIFNCEFYLQSFRTARDCSEYVIGVHCAKYQMTPCPGFATEFAPNVGGPAFQAMHAYRCQKAGFTINFHLEIKEKKS